MAIKDLSKYEDIRGTIRRNGRYPLVGTAVKDTIVVHHSMTAMGLKGSTPQAFANTHIDTNCWPGIAYPFVIMPDGTINQCDDLDRRTYHAGDTNTRSIGVCVVGDFRKEGAKEVPTNEQKQSLYLLVKELQKTLPKLTRILGHQECPGYSWKNCPGDMWNYKDVISGKDLSKQSTVGKDEGELKLEDVKVKAEPTKGIGVLKVIEGTVLREDAVYNADITGRVEAGGEYIVHEYKNGWYRIGGWIYSKHVNFLPCPNVKMQ